MMKRLEKIVCVLDKITVTATNIVLFSTMAVVSVSVLMRIFISSPIAGLTDIVSVFNALAVAFAINVAERRKKHIKVDFIREYMPPRVGKFIQYFMNVLTILVLAVITWRFFLYIFSTFRYGSATWIMNIPHWPVVVCLFIGLVFFMITFIFNFLSLITNYKSKGTKEHDDAINF